MREDYYAEYYVFEERNWWFVSRRHIIARVLRHHLPQHGPQTRKILDAGCGTGINLSLLREFGEVAGVDNSPLAVGFCTKRNEADVRQADLCNLPFEDGEYDLVTALDVLEHIEDHAQALNEMARVCRTGGRILLTVPAFPSLWSDHDVVNHHIRRYRPQEFREFVESSGLQISHWSGMNMLLLPVAYSWRTYRNLRRFFAGDVNPEGPRPDNSHRHPLINSALMAAFKAEAPFIERYGLPLGLSILCLAEKIEDRTS